MPYKDLEKRRAAVREAVKRHRAAGLDKPIRKPGVLPELAELRLETARDVVALLRGQVEAVLADGSIPTVERARTISLLAAGLLRCFEQVDLVERLEVLERAAEDRRNGGTIQ